MLEYMYIVYGCAVEPVGTQGAPFLVDGSTKSTDNTVSVRVSVRV